MATWAISLRRILPDRETGYVWPSSSAGVYSARNFTSTPAMCLHDVELRHIFTVNNSELHLTDEGIYCYGTWRVITFCTKSQTQAPLVSTTSTPSHFTIASHSTLVSSPFLGPWPYKKLKVRPLKSQQSRIILSNETAGLSFVRCLNLHQLYTCTIYLQFPK